jgi:hypothetical protein
MKRITKIEARNMKGLTFSEDVADITVFQGRNFTGKTARLNAATFALTGYIPGCAKTNAGIFSLSSGSEMECGIEWDDASQWRRCLTQKGKSIKLDATDNALDAVTLDASVYFDASPKARREMILRHCPDIAFDVDELRESVAKIRPDDHPVDVVKDVLLCVEQIIDEALIGQEPVDGIEAAIKAIDAERKEAAAAVKRHEGAAQSLTELRDIVHVSSRAGVELRKLREEREAVLKSLNAIDAVTEQVAALKVRRAGLKVHDGDGVQEMVAAKRQEVGFDGTADELATVLAEIEGKILGAISEDLGLAAQAQQYGHDVATLQNVRLQIAELKAQDVPEMPSDETFAEIRDRIERARKLESALGDCESEIAALDRWLDKNEVRHGQITDAVAAHETQLAEIDAQPSCPHCGSDSEGWRENIKDGINGKLSDEEFKLEGLLEETGKLSLKRAEVIATRDDRRAELEDIGNASGDLEKAQEASRASANHAMRTEALTERADDLQKRIDANKDAADKRGRVEAFGRELTARRNQLQELRNALAAAAALDENAQTIADIDRQVDELLKAHGGTQRLDYEYREQTIKLQEIDGAIGEKDIEEKKGIAARAKLQAVEESIAARDKAKAEEATHKAVLAELETCRDEFINATLNELSKRANALCADVLETPLNVCDGELGRWSGRNFVRLGSATFSGAELAIAYAAVCIALATTSDGPRIAIVDELGRLDADTKRALLLRVRELIDAGKIDQFIGADASESVGCGEANVKVVTVWN